MVLDDIVGECSIPERDWESIINIYNQNNRSFPIPPLICSKIIQEIKDGRMPKTVFRQYGASYSKFRNRFNKTKLSLEELSSRENFTDEDWNMIQTCRHDPYFILGLDIDRASAFHFNESTDLLKFLSKSKAETWLAYMKEIHSEEFSKKEENKSVEVVIQFGPDILESV